MLCVITVARIARRSKSLANHVVKNVLLHIGHSLNNVRDSLIIRIGMLEGRFLVILGIRIRRLLVLNVQTSMDNDVVIRNIGATVTMLDGHVLNHSARVGTSENKACLLYTSDAADERSSV